MTCSRSFSTLLLLITLSIPAFSRDIPVGVLIFEGNTPDGSSIFHFILRPPSGVSFARLKPAFFTDGNGRSFSLPAPLPGLPHTYDFLLLTAPDSGFTSCPCRSVSFLFTAPPGVQVRFNKKKAEALSPLSATSVIPADGAKFLKPQQSTIIFLKTAKNKNGHND